MKRRELLKGLGALTALTVLPVTSVLSQIAEQRFHFVGLGSGGANVVNRINEMGIKGKSSCITWFPFFDNPYAKLNHIHYEYPREFRACKEIGKKTIPLTDEMKSLFSENSSYIVFVGLGGFTGSSLINSVVEFLETKGINYLAVCSLPATSEGRWRNDYATQRKSELANYKRVLFHNNNPIFDRNENISVREAFRLADLGMIELFTKKVGVLTT